MNRLLTPVCFLALAALSGCAEEGSLGTAAEEHVWEEQVQAIDEAREVEDVIGAAAAAQDQALDD